MKIINRIILILIFLAGIFFLVCFYFDIIYPSYLSVSNACGTISDEELNNSNYVVAGEYNVCSDTITIYYNVTSVNKHEEIHRQERIQGRLSSCDRKFFLFFNELEAYIMENLNSKTLNFIYNTTNFN